MGSVPVHLSASFPVKVSGHRKLTGYKKGYRLGIYEKVLLEGDQNQVF